MTDPKTIEGSKERAADRGRADLGLVDAARDAGTSLGNPAVVERLVQGFAHRVFEMIKWRRDGDVDADELVRQIRGECDRVGSVFMGGDKAYAPVPGWNTPRGLGMAVTVLLGGETVRAASSPAAALLEWLAAQLMAADLSDDADVGEKVQACVTSVIDTLLGTPA